MYTSLDFRGKSGDINKITDIDYVREVVASFCKDFDIKKLPEAQEMWYVHPTPSHRGIDYITLVERGHVAVHTRAADMNVDISVRYSVDFNRVEAALYLAKKFDMKDIFFEDPNLHGMFARRN